MPSNPLDDTSRWAVITSRFDTPQAPGEGKSMNGDLYAQYSPSRWGFGWPNPQPPSSRPPYYSLVQLDGLSDEEFQYRYAMACWIRESKGRALSMIEVHNMITELASWPRGSQDFRRPQPRSQKTQTQQMDYADWLRLLHGISYKPGWLIELVPPSPPWAELDLRVSAEIDCPIDGRYLSTRTLTATHPMCEEIIRTTQDKALHIIGNLIAKCELKIKDLWLKHIPEEEVIHYGREKQ